MAKFLEQLERTQILIHLLKNMYVKSLEQNQRQFQLKHCNVIVMHIICLRLPLLRHQSRSLPSEVRGLQKSEIREVEEDFAKGQKGSSAMPHKRNPIGSENMLDSLVLFAVI